MPAQSPPPLLSRLYFGLAHLSLIAACAVVALAPASVTGFFYHPRMVFVVHLVTLGWITSAILGALSRELPARRRDYVVFALYFLGASGIVFHFLIDELSGVASSGPLVMLAVGQVGARFLASSGARMPVAARAHVVLALANFFLAAATGMLLAVNKLFPVLPGYVLTNVYAHAHLASLGWATMMAFVPGLLLPGPDRSDWTAILLFETGVLGLFVTLLLQSPWSALFAMVTVAGIGIFLARTAPPRPRPSWQPFAYLIAASAAGLVLVWQPTTELTLRLATVYGVFGLVGFLAWILAAAVTRPLPGVLLPWSAGVPALAAGFFLESSAVVGLGGWLLLAAAVVQAVRGSGPRAR